MNEIEVINDKNEDKFRKEYLAKGYAVCGHCKRRESRFLKVQSNELVPA